ncbi:MAG: TetR/AcrR family transcriptional regulator [Acidimicrobiales bacterium]
MSSWSPVSPPSPPPASVPERSSRWAGVPAETRRAERRRLLLDAALGLLGTGGWSTITVRSVCQACRLNPRYFYESFEDLDALVVALYDQLVEELGIAVTQAVERAGPDPHSRIRATVESTVCFVDGDRRRGRVLYGEALGSEALNRRRIDSGFAVADLIAGALDDKVHRLSATLVVGGFREILMAWLDGRIRISRAQLIDDATELFMAVGEAATQIAANRPAGRASPSR